MKNFHELMDGRFVATSPGNGDYFFCDTEDQAIDWLAEHIITPTKPPRFVQQPTTTIAVLVTNRCNLACSYCYMGKGGDIDFNTITLDIFIEAMEKMVSKKVEHMGLSFIGGEPTMAMEAILEICAYCNKKYKSFSAGTSSNGTLLLNKIPGDTSMSVLEWFIENKFALKLSLAGPKEIHDADRSMCGKSTYGSIIRALQLAKELDPTYARDYIDYRVTNVVGDGTLLQRLKFFNSLISNGYGNSVHIEPDIENIPPDKIEAAKEMVDREFIECSEWAISEILSGNTPIWHDVLGRMCIAIITHKIKSNSCGAGGSYMSIGPSGELLACHRTVGANIGDSKNGLQAKPLAEWADSRTTFRPNCISCDIRNYCGGGCRAISTACGLKTSDTVEMECVYTRSRLMIAFHIVDVIGEKKLMELYG